MKRAHQLLLGAAALFFIPLGFRPLWDADEGRYAEIAREMLQLKDWITPHLNYVLYFEKPPLLYWLTSISMAILGDNAFAARLWCALFALGTVALLVAIGREWKSERVGLLAGAILATSFGFFIFSQFLVLDMGLTFWTTWILGCAARFLRKTEEREMNRSAVLLAVGAAGGMLTKGPVALVLPGLFILAASIWTRRAAWVRQISWGIPIFVFLALTVPWFFLVSRRHSFFLNFFFIHEHVARFFTSVHHRQEPVYFFIPVLVGGFLPWSFFLPTVARQWFANKAFALRRDPEAALWMFWSIGVFIFFSLSHSKLVTYLLPTFPALALLVAERFDAAWDAETAPDWLRNSLVGLIAFFGITLVFLKWPQPPVLFRAPAMQIFLAQAGLLYVGLAAAIFILIGVRSLQHTANAWIGIVAAQLVLLGCVFGSLAALNPYFSTRALAAVINERAQPQERLVGYGVSYENVLQTLAFYTRRRIAVYGDAGELTLGRDHDPQALEWFVAEEPSAAAVAHLPTGSWIVTDPPRWHQLNNSDVGDEFVLIEQQGNLCLLQKVA